MKLPGLRFVLIALVFLTVVGSAVICVRTIWQSRIARLVGKMEVLGADDITDCYVTRHGSRLALDRKSIEAVFDSCRTCLATNTDLYPYGFGRSSYCAEITFKSGGNCCADIMYQPKLQILTLYVYNSVPFDDEVYIQSRISDPMRIKLIEAIVAR